MDGITSRRELVRGGIAAAAAAAVTLARPPASAARAVPADSDATVLAATLRVEQLLVIAYRSVLGSGVVTAAVRRRLEAMLAQELQHVAGLERSMRALGAPAPRIGIRAAQKMLAAHHVHVSLTGLRDQHECLKLLIDVESLAEGAYFAAIAKLSDPALIRDSTEAMGCEAQHWTVLSALRHHGDVTRSVPYPFVQGSA
jgi:ferritin-like protein